MSTLKVGIATYEDMMARTLAIARGERTPKRTKPKIWFTSMESAARVLSEHRGHIRYSHSDRRGG